VAVTFKPSDLEFIPTQILKAVAQQPPLAPRS